jgi:hypothetical protein
MLMAHSKHVFPYNLFFFVISAGFVRQKRGDEGDHLLLVKRGIFFRFFLSNEPGTELLFYCKLTEFLSWKFSDSFDP